MMDPPFTHATFLATYHRHQHWSLPDVLIYYITKNPSSSKAYEKLLQTCKYFFIKNPVLIVRHFLYTYYQGERNTYISGTSDEDLKKLPIKIWVTDEFQSESFFNNNNKNDQYFVTSIIPKIYHCDVKKLRLCNQNISFKFFQFIASKCEDFWFDDVNVMNEKGSIIELENLFETLSNVQRFKYYLGDEASSIITSKTAIELIKNANFLNLRKFTVNPVPETFDIDNFYAFIKKNKETKNYLSFSNQISHACQIRLQRIVNEIIASKNNGYKVPYIGFEGSFNSELWNLYVQS